MKRWLVEVCIPADDYALGRKWVSYPSMKFNGDKYDKSEVLDVIQSAKNDGYDKVRYMSQGAIWNYI